MKALLMLFLLTSTLAAAEPKREEGLSVHLLPERVAKISGERGGFTVTDPKTKRPGASYAQPEELLAHFEKLPASVQKNGLWVVTTHPSSYSEAEQAKLKSLGALCAQKKVPAYTCRASELPKGWKRLE